MWVLAKHCEEWCFYIIHFNIFFSFSYTSSMATQSTICNLCIFRKDQRLHKFTSFKPSPWLPPSRNHTGELPKLISLITDLLVAGTVGSDLHFCHWQYHYPLYVMSHKVWIDFRQSNSTQHGGAITPQIPVRGISMSPVMSFDLLYSSNSSFRVSPGSQQFGKSACSHAFLSQAVMRHSTLLMRSILYSVTVRFLTIVY